MKKIILAILFATASISCSKNEPEDNKKPLTEINPIQANWTWIQSNGGIAGATYNPANTGYTKSLEINSTEIKDFKNGILIETYPYTIESQNSIYGEGLKPMLIFNNNKPKQSFEIVMNELQLNDECYDCFSSKYIKTIN